MRVRALAQYNFDADRFRELRVPVMLQIGTESLRDLYITDALAAILGADVYIEELPDQAHEAMTTAPQICKVRFMLLVGVAISSQAKVSA